MRVKARSRIPIQALQNISFGGSPVNVSVSLPIPKTYQENSQWCWAACSKMVMDHYVVGNLNKQCCYVSWLFKNSSCCTSLTIAACNKPCLVNDVSMVYSNYSIKSSLTAAAKSFSDVCYEIDNQRPIEAGIIWNNVAKGATGGHVVIISGYASDATGDYLIVNDPDANGKGKNRILYNDFLNPYNKGKWKFTWIFI